MEMFKKLEVNPCVVGKLEHIQFRRINKSSIGVKEHKKIAALPGQLNHDFTILRNAKNQWFICIPSGLHANKLEKIDPIELGNQSAPASAFYC